MRATVGRLLLLCIAVVLRSHLVVHRFLDAD